MATSHSLAADDQNEVQHDFYSCDTTGASISITWCWHHMLLMAYSNGAIAVIKERLFK